MGLSDLSLRGTEEVIRDHLHLAQHGSIEEDLARNYAEELVILTGRGIFRGHRGLRDLNERLNQELPHARFRYRSLVVAGGVGLLEWTARARDARTSDGVDSYVVQDGKIVAQTIHYTVRQEGAEGS